MLKVLTELLSYICTAKLFLFLDLDGLFYDNSRCFGIIWKISKDKSFRNKCFIFDIYIDLFVDDIQSLCTYIHTYTYIYIYIYIYILICIYIHYTYNIYIYVYIIYIYIRKRDTERVQLCVDIYFCIIYTEFICTYNISNADIEDILNSDRNMLF